MHAPRGASDPAFPVFVKRGDVRAEVDRLLSDLGTTPQQAGFHKYFHVAKANQTVVMVLGRDTPLAVALRGRSGWVEPIEGS